jgi:subtilisin family serine protease
MRKNIGADHDTPEILDMKKARYDALKRGAIGFLPAGEGETIKDYSHLPMVFMKVNSLSALQQLLDRPEVVRVYENKQKFAVLSSSLPFINQPQVASMNIKGGGTAVAVLDTGVNYLNSAFGTCTGGGTPGDCCPGGDCNAAPPAVPTGCKVACVHDFAASDGQLDDDGHGTNVSGIVAGVAPDTKVIGLDVFTGSGAWDSDIIAAINWCIHNKAAYNIVAINMSLGDGLNYTSQCPSDSFATPVSAAKSAGILSAIAAGNEGRTNGLSSPACVPTAVSVGAVYDTDSFSRVTYSNCTDTNTVPDQVTCFSNSASFLTLLAPGARITAAGLTYFGTSQATPHIAGSIAVLRGQNGFSETVDQTVTRMTSTGVLDPDAKSGITKPRIDLLAAVNAGGGGAFSISGTVTISGTTTPLAGLTINLSGAASRTTTTNGSGFYQFTGLNDGSYTVTPGSAAYAFTPPSYAVTITGADQANKNFTGTPLYSITGTVTSGGRGLQGVTMTLDGAATGATTTDSSGNYSFTGLHSGDYTVTPSRAGYVFTPANRAVTIGAANVTGQNFTGTVAYSISGAVTSGGSPLPNVTMNLSGAAGGSTLTDASGSYTFTGLAKGTYTVTPSLAGYSFTPASRTITVKKNVAGQNFTATAVAATYSISGTVTVSGTTTPIAGVTMTLTGGATATTNSSGIYQFSGLSNGTYTVTPTPAGYTFDPTSRTVPVSGGNVTGQDFAGTPAGGTTYSISGTVTVFGTTTPIAGVTMTLTGGATTTTNSSGIYQFSGLSNGTYVVTSSSASYTFAPTSRTVPVSGGNVTGQDFAGTPTGSTTYSISGTVTSGGNPLQGVDVELSGASKNKTTTDAGGNYIFTGLANGSYTVTPRLYLGTFTPTSRAVTINGANVTGQDFAKN